MENGDLAAQRLWETFLQLTQEMLKFLEKDNVDMFLDLLDQRLKLQKSIEDLANETYHLTVEGKEVIARINPLNREIQYKARLWLNQKKKSQSMAKAYDSLGFASTGQWLNREF